MLNEFSSKCNRLTQACNEPIHKFSFFTIIIQFYNFQQNNVSLLKKKKLSTSPN